MTLYHALLLGLLQGVTEFLPISSSGHLALMEHYLGLSFDALTLQYFDIALHGGSLAAILLYYARTWLEVARRPFARGKDGSPPLLFLLIVGTLPAAIIGLFGMEWIESARSPLAIALGFLITGGFLLASGFYEGRFPGRDAVTWKQALGMGIGQAFALVPSISRSGLTIASGRFLGVNAERATTFTFLLGAPALAGALLLTALKGGTSLAIVGWPEVTVGFLTSFLASIAVMHIFILCTRTFGVWMWAAYLFVLAALLLGDEFLPLLREVELEHVRAPLGLLLTLLFFALLLEAAPFTSLFSPGFTMLVTTGILLRGDIAGIVAAIMVGTLALIIGNLMGYLPAREARASVHWKEKADARLHRAERFFARWGTLAVIVGGWWGPTRSVISIAAGLGNMPVRRYLIATLAGSSLWVAAIMLMSSMLGEVWL